MNTLTAVLQSSLDGALLIDEEGHILDANDEAEEIFQQERAFLNGRQLTSLLKDNHALQILCCISELPSGMNSARGHAIEVEAIRGGGTTIPLEIRIGSIQSEGRYYIVAMRDISERKRQEETIFDLAYHDALTGLPNRVLMQDRLTQVVRAGQRYGKRAAIMFIDLDRFKNINDTQGHHVGDQVLKEIAQRLELCVRKSDTIARQGGDEFVAILSDLSAQEDTALVADRIRQECSRPVLVSGKGYSLSASIGIAIFPDDGLDVETLMKHADTAMYHAKNQGKNQFHFFTPEMNIRAVQRMSLEAQLERALRQGEFMLHYQPQVDMGHRGIIGLEALIRWDSDMGMILPGQFIPAAEESGLIVQIGEWALYEACRQIAEWEKCGIFPPKVSVNISGGQFTWDLLPKLEAALRDNGVRPHALELEITESMLANDEADAALIMRELSKMGLDLAIDDFGTGYSNLASLKRFPLNRIKIDREFVTNLPFDENDKAIVQAIMAIAKHMGLSTVAEGIETEGHRVAFQALGCDAWQGFLFSRPLSAPEIEERFFKQTQVAVG